MFQAEHINSVCEGTKAGRSPVHLRKGNKARVRGREVQKGGKQKEARNKQGKSQSGPHGFLGFIRKEYQEICGAF